MIRKLLAWSGLALVGLGLAISLLTDHSYVTTPSMWPTIPPGSEIFVTHTSNVRVGQVIEFRANGLTRAHRLIEIKHDGTFVTKGDNPQNAPDVFEPPVTRSDVIGVVTHAPRWLGFPQLILNQPGYGLAWLRTELGVPGKSVLSLAAGLVAFTAASSRSRSGGSDPEPAGSLATAPVAGPDHAPDPDLETTLVLAAAAADEALTERRRYDDGHTVVLSHRRLPPVPTTRPPAASRRGRHAAPDDERRPAPRRPGPRAPGPAQVPGERRGV